MTEPSKILEAMTAAVEALEPLEQQERVDALQSIGKILGVAQAAETDKGSVTKPVATPGAGGGDLSSVTPKEFMDQKDPQTDVERVACLAYFMAHERGESKFKTRDLTALNTDAAQSKFNTSQAVDNATRTNGYLASGGKGTHQITSLGEKVVRALPDHDAAKAVRDAAPKKRRRRSRRKKGASAPKS